MVLHDGTQDGLLLSRSGSLRVYLALLIMFFQRIIWVAFFTLCSLPSDRPSGPPDCPSVRLTVRPTDRPSARSSDRPSEEAGGQLVGGFGEADTPQGQVNTFKIM